MYPVLSERFDVSKQHAPLDDRSAEGLASTSTTGSVAKAVLQASAHGRVVRNGNLWNVMRCGACRGHHSSVDDVRRCYGNQRMQSSEPHERRGEGATRSHEVGGFSLMWSEIKGRPKEPPQQPSVSARDVDDEFIDLARQRMEDAEVERKRRSLVPKVRETSVGPLRSCADCGREVVNCAHFTEIWCNPCRTYTTTPGLHQNCIPGQWK